MAPFGSSNYLTRRSRNQTGRKIKKLEPPVKCLHRSVAIGRGAWCEKDPAKNCKDFIGVLPSHFLQTAPHGTEDGEMAPFRESHVFHKSLWIQSVIQGEMAPLSYGEMTPFGR